MTPAQCRMARAAIEFGVRELAEIAKVSTNTITRFERGEPLKERTVDAIRQALEDVGVVFVEENGHGPGARLRRGAPYTGFLFRMSQRGKLSIDVLAIASRADEAWHIASDIFHGWKIESEKSGQDLLIKALVRGIRVGEAKAVNLGGIHMSMEIAVGDSVQQREDLLPSDPNHVGEIGEVIDPGRIPQSANDICVRWPNGEECSYQPGRFVVVQRAAASMPNEGLRPDELNASNDD